MSEFGFDDPEILTNQEKRGLNQAGRNRDPSPEEIRLACLAIQAEWSPAEHRIRAGLAPVDPVGRARMTRQLESRG